MYNKIEIKYNVYKKLNVANTWQGVKCCEAHLGGKVQLLF